MKNIVGYLTLWIIAIGIIAPIVVVAGVSIGATKTIVFPPTELSLHWYQILLSDPDWLKAILTSLIVAAFAAIISVTLALAINYVLWRRKSGFSKLVFSLGLGPFLLPPIILALGASLFWAEMGWYGRIEATVVSHGIFFVTLPLVILARGFAGLTDDVVEAAQMMGATPKQLFRTIVLPLITPYLLTGFTLVFIISVNEYLIANMISGFVVETLPVKIFNNVRYGYSPVVAAASMLFITITIGMLLLVARSTDLLSLLGVTKDTDR
jgi:putative spermidine/putrescine transport system permease protein